MNWLKNEWQESNRLERAMLVVVGVALSVGFSAAFMLVLHVLMDDM